MEIKQIGERIYSTRIERGMTLSQIATQIGINKSTVQRYEKGLINNPKIPVLWAIADALHIERELLIPKREVKNNDGSISTSKKGNGTVGSQPVDPLASGERGEDTGHHVEREEDVLPEGRGADGGEAEDQST